MENGLARHLPGRQSSNWIARRSRPQLRPNFETRRAGANRTRRLQSNRVAGSSRSDFRRRGAPWRQCTLPVSQERAGNGRIQRPRPVDVDSRQGLRGRPHDRRSRGPIPRPALRAGCSRTHGTVRVFRALFRQTRSGRCEHVGDSAAVPISHLHHRAQGRTVRRPCARGELLFGTPSRRLSLPLVGDRRQGSRCRMGRIAAADRTNEREGWRLDLDHCDSSESRRQMPRRSRPFPNAAAVRPRREE